MSFNFLLPFRSEPDIWGLPAKVFWGHNTWFVAGLIGMVSPEFVNARLSLAVL